MKTAHGLLLTEQLAEGHKGKKTSKMTPIQAGKNDRKRGSIARSPLGRNAL
jgi:hypothetical protein